MTKEEIVRMVGELKRIFDIVRLVDVNVNSQFSFDDEGIFWKNLICATPSGKRTSAVKTVFLQRHFQEEIR